MIAAIMGVKKKNAFHNFISFYNTMNLVDI